MFRKIAITAVTTAVIATSAVSVTTTTASAKHGRNGALAAGAIIGLAAGAIIGSTAARGHYYAPRQCWDKAVRRWDPYYRQYVVVGYRRVCR